MENNKTVNPSINQSDASNHNDEIDLMELFNKLFARKFTIIFVVTGFAILGILYAKLQPSIFRAEALLQIESKQAGMPGLAELDGLFTAESEAVTEIEIIKSKMIIGEVVDKLQLTIQLEPNILPFYSEQYYGFSGEDGELNPPVVEGYVSGGEQVRITQFDVAKPYLDNAFTLTYIGNEQFELAYDDNVVLSGRVGELVSNQQITIFVQQFIAHPNTQFALTKVTRLEKIDEIRTDLVVSEVGKQSGILRLYYDSADASRAEEILRAVTETYVRKNINRNSAEASKSLSFLEYRLPEIETELNAAESRLNEYQVSAESVNILAETQSLLTQMVAIEEKISELQLQEIDIQRRFTTTHPNYLAFVSQMAELQDRKARFNRQIRSLPKTQQELLRLRRDVEVNTQIYTQLLNSIQELNILKAGTIGNVRIIDDAEANLYESVKPKRALIVVISSLLGGMLAVAYVLIRSAMRRGVENPQEIENLGLAVLAAVPYSSFQEELMTKKLFLKNNKKNKITDNLLAVSKPTDITVESIRSVRTSLHFAMIESGNNRVMITGPSPGIGKSFISVNLAVTLAESGKKVVVVDADMRKGTIYRYFNLDKTIGLSNYLIGDVDYNSIQNPSGVANLSVIGSGTFPPNPSELLMSKRFNELLDKLSEDYDLVLIDSPPIMAVTDAAIIGQRTGTNLIVCRYGINPIKEIEITATRLDRAGIHINGVVFNAMQQGNGTGYGYGYGYGYYTYEYDNENPSSSRKNKKKAQR
jgi:tyrosine-protein kinase Etk/Wzc